MVEDAEAAEEEEDEAAGYRIKNKNPTQRCGGKKICYTMLARSLTLPILIDYRPSTHWPKPTLIPYSLDMIATYCNNLYPLC